MQENEYKEASRRDTIIQASINICMAKSALDVCYRQRKGRKEAVYEAEIGRCRLSSLKRLQQYSFNSCHTDRRTDTAHAAYHEISQTKREESIKIPV